jgi:hypothetical protein
MKLSTFIRTKIAPKYCQTTCVLKEGNCYCIVGAICKEAKIPVKQLNGVGTTDIAILLFNQAIVKLGIESPVDADQLIGWNDCKNLTYLEIADKVEEMEKWILS